MNSPPLGLCCVVLGLLTARVPVQAGVIFETTSPYHHIRVLDDGNFRTLCFDDAQETRMSVHDPLKGHFEYTEYFHLAWLWNPQLTNVLMVGLGGGSAQRSFEAYYSDLKIQTIEIDPVVAKVASEYFNLKESAAQRIQLEDGRVFLRRSREFYDLVILDAYVQGRYGSSLPQHLATKEFFEIVRSHLTTNGVVAYNVIGSLSGWHADIIGAIYRTLKTVFPQVYLFPAQSSMNIVIVATRSPLPMDLTELRRRGLLFLSSHPTSLPDFRSRIESFRAAAPPAALASPVLLDDYAPVEGLAGGGGAQPASLRPQSPEEDLFTFKRKEMVADQLAAADRGITNLAVLAAMEKVPRHEFVLPAWRPRAYDDTALPIGHNQTMAQPYLVGFMTQTLAPQPGERILEIGTGSGYQTAVLSEIASKIYTIEIVEELATRAATNLTRLGYTNVQTKIGDGARGWADQAPFDAILLTCAPEKVPQTLLAQLKEGGRMILPLGPIGKQRLVLLIKHSPELERVDLRPVRFPPMTGEIKIAVPKTTVTAPIPTNQP